MRACWRPGICLALLLASAGVTTAAGSAVVAAARDGSIQELRRLLESRPDVNVPDVDGTTALHWAVHRDNAEAVQMLLKAGANAKAQNRYHVTPLSLAATNGNGQIVALLLDAGADANVALPGGETVLMTAARTGGVAAIKALVARGARVDAAESVRGQNALMWAAARGNTSAVVTLLDAGADIHARSKDVTLGEGPNDGNEAELLGVLPIRMTALLFAAREGHIDTVRTLLTRGANVNDKLAEGTSALVLAIANGRWELASVLLDEGADPNSADQGWAALHELARTRTPSAGQLPPPVQTGRMSSLELATRLIARGADVNQRMTKEMIAGYRTPFKRVGATPANVAAKGADADMLRVLVASGADLSIPNAIGTTPLMAAAGVELGIAGEDSGTDADALAAVKVILDAGADVGATNESGETALHGAARRGANAVVQALVDKGAKLDVAEKRGLTPYNYAEGKAVSGYRPQPQTVSFVAELMKQRGLEVVVDDAYGFSRETSVVAPRRPPK